MKKLFSILLILTVTLGLFISTADAKRFGGGRSFGQSHSYSAYNRPAPRSTNRNLAGGII
jgi:hypothetical protein